MVRAFHKRQREANSGEAAQEREGYKKRLLELEAEVKVARSLAAAQVDEASQTHAAELGALQRRVARGDGRVVAGAHVEAVVVFEEQRPAGGVEAARRLGLDHKLVLCGGLGGRQAA